MPADRLRQNRIPGMWTIRTDDTRPGPRRMRIIPHRSNRREAGKPVRYPAAEGIRTRTEQKADMLSDREAEMTKKNTAERKKNMIRIGALVLAGIMAGSVLLAALLQGMV